ncbi:MAG TPA: alcohol dehydrogenase catalytic domain-containing protein, partial [Rhodocyclaceae bacterium]
MTTEALAAVARTREGALGIEQVMLDDPCRGELLVRLEACGICHTDMKFRERLPLPAVLGHEGVGIVEAVGSDVRHARVGDRVLISYPFCTECPACRRAEPWCCERIGELKFGGRRLDGSQPVSVQGAGVTSAFFQQSSFATHAITLEQSVIPVAEQLPAATLAALPCGVQTGAGAVMNTFGAGPGDSLMVFGAGAVGISAIRAARVAGLGTVICAEPLAGR